MSLQLITGVSGSGKSTLCYDMASELAAADRDRPVFVLIPDQYSQEAGRILIEKNNGGILNIDVLSFRRLAYRALGEFRGLDSVLLDDEGKIMLLRSVLAEHMNELEYFTKGISNPGFLDECKSLLSELIEYAIGDDSFEIMEELFGVDSLSASKIRDIRRIYHYMEDGMADTYRMAEELIPLLTSLVPKVSFLENAIVCMDEFTGFTPVQYELISALMVRCSQVIVTVTTDTSRHDMFSLSNNTVKKLMDSATLHHVAINETINVGYGDKKTSYRLRENPVLNWLERNIFSYNNAKWCGHSANKNSNNNTEKTSEKQPEEQQKNQIENQSEFPIEIYVCRNERDEAEYAAGEVKRLISAGVDPGVIAVVTPDLERYEPHLRRCMDMTGVPYFFDTKKSLGMNPLAEYVMSFLSMMRHGFDVSGVVRFLRCGVSFIRNRDDVDVFENYILATGRHGFNSYKTDWTYNVSPGRISLVRVNRVRKTFYDAVSETVISMRGGKKPVRDFAEAVCKLLIGTGVPGRLDRLSEGFENDGETLMATEYGRLYPALIDLFDTMVDLMGDNPVSLAEFEEILRAGVSEGVLGFVPPVRGQVLIGDIERSRLSETEYLLFLGNTDEYFSGGGSDAGLFTVRERDMIREAGIELAPSGEERRDRESFYLYRLITKPSKKIILTYPRINDGGDDVRPAYLIDMICSMFSVNAREFVSRDHVNRVFSSVNQNPINKHTASITPETALLLYGDNLYASVSRFESFVKCPYAHFLNYGLGLHERMECSIEANDRGTVCHDALERLSERMRAEGTGFDSIDEEKLLELGEAAFDDTINGYRDDIFHTDKRREYAMKRMKRVYLDSITVLRAQMQAGEFHQEGWEVSFGEREESIPAPQLDLTGGRHLQLRGRIDRYDMSVDGDTGYIRLIDYKSSARDLTFSGIYYGLEMQLMIYMYVLTEYIRTNGDVKKAVPAAVLYQKIDEEEKSVNTLETDDDKLKDMRLKSLRPSGYVNEDTEVLRRIDPGLVSGAAHSSIAAHLRTKKDGTFYSDSLPHLLTDDEFKKLMKHTGENIMRCGTEMYEGRIEAAPYRWNESSGKPGSGCDFCPYAGVCGVEARTRDSMSRVLEYKDDRSGITE
ncbi:MAG: PD-(D/E)XK nuclease family protein [Eubacterium sp.]|nr:PD-(D/E)XK nuclease family protein [Eubacterium sp.]